MERIFTERSALLPSPMSAAGAAAGAAGAAGLASYSSWTGRSSESGESRPLLSRERGLVRPSSSGRVNDFLTVISNGLSALRSIFSGRTSPPYPAGSGRVDTDSGRSTAFTCGFTCGFTRGFTRATAQENAERAVAFRMTAFFEGTGPAALQTYDDGGVSYGLFQATLRSGSLYDVVRNYTAHSEGALSTALMEFLPRLKVRDGTLRSDEQFLGYLKSAGDEPAMIRAQQEQATGAFWRPAARAAEEESVSSPLGKAIFFDTAVQGGLAAVVRSTTGRIRALSEGRPVSEREYLLTFLEERRERLHRLADKKERNGDRASARALRQSAASRISALASLVVKEQLSLERAFVLGGELIQGLDRSR